MKLFNNSNITHPLGPVVLLVLDGVGDGPKDDYDAVHLARTPNLDFLRTNGLSRLIKAHGTSVGLPTDSDIGNSEVGHNILGAGRVFSQGATSVENAIQSGAIWEGKWRDIIANTRNNKSSLHLIGLLSDGNVHSHQRHLFALLKMAADERVPRVFVHALLDGRDVPDHSAHKYIDSLEKVFSEIRQSTGFDYFIASGGGRMSITMDRYQADWVMVERGWKVQVLAQGPKYKSAGEAIEDIRKNNPGISDQFLPGFVIVGTDETPIGRIEDGDSVVLFNFRGDRALEVSQAFCEGPSFQHFNRERVPKVYFAGMMLYDGDTGMPENYLVSPETVSDTISECLADTGIGQFACAETQKYGHMTYFWNGNRSSKFNSDIETYVEIPSDNVHFEERPWMKSAETADTIIEAISSDKYPFIRANFAGCDMVGHSGKLVPTIIALEAIDLAIGRIASVVAASRGCLIITSDHGNSEDMVERDSSGAPKLADGSPIGRTSHTRSPVPFVIWDRTGRSFELRKNMESAGLSNIAATIVELLGYNAPPQFDQSLIQATAT